MKNLRNLNDLTGEIFALMSDLDNKRFRAGEISTLFMAQRDGVLRCALLAPLNLNKLIP